MFLQRIALHNVRSVETLALDFTGSDGEARRWTLLLGENGCGKSSVLRAIALLLAGSEALPDLLGEPDAWIRNGAAQCAISATVATAKGETRDIGLVIHRGEGLRELFARNRLSLAALDAAIAHTERQYFTLAYGASRRLPGDGAQAAFHNPRVRSARAQGMASMFSTVAPLISLEQWAMDLDYRRGQTALAAMRQALDLLLPGMTFQRIDRETRQMIFATVDGEVPLAGLSEGYQNMAAWCGDLLYRITEAFPDRHDPLATRGVLLVDELDLHLHPVWRRRLVEFLSAALPNFQFIATTHSALTVQQSGEGEVFVLRRQGDKERPVLQAFAGEPRKMMLHQLLMSPMFGLVSMDSVETEQARDEVRELLSRKDALSRTDRQRLRSQQKVLDATPRWDAVPHYAREQTALLASIRQALDEAGPPPGVSAVKLKATARRLGAGK